MNTLFATFLVLIKENIIDFLFITVGVVITGISIKDFIKTIQSINWRPTKGTVVYSNIKQDSELNNYPCIKYYYIVDGKKYFSKNFYPSRIIRSHTKEEARKKLFSIGQEIVVYYNQKNPKNACLYKNRGYAGVIFFSLIGLVCIMIGILHMTKIIKLL